jgi:purine-binding chemotaxis protein CheW
MEKNRFDDLLERFFYSPDEDVGAWVELAPEISDSVTEVEELPEEFLAFELDDETYAVPIGAVREILKVPQITSVPRVAKQVLGVMNVRGEMLPVFDLKHCLHLEDAPRRVTGPGDVARESRVVLLKDAEGDAGILVDRVKGVVRLMLSKLEPAPALGTGGNAVAGIGRKDGELFILLDVDEALA